MMEILFFAFLAGYLIFRLWSILGKRTGFEAPPSSMEESDNVIALPVRPSKKASPPKEPAPTVPSAPPFEEGLKKIEEADPTFRLEHFLRGAVAAFEIIVEAFAKGD